MFEKDYCEFKDGDLVKVKCQCCGELIKEMHEVPSVKFPGKMVRELKTLSNFATRSISLENGTYANVLICANERCRTVDFKLYYDLIEKQWHRAMIQELEAAGRETNIIEMHKDGQKKNLKIRRK